MVRGRQAVGKYREQRAHDLVELWVAVVRLPSVTTDIVVTLNRPLLVHGRDGKPAAPPENAYTDAQAAAVMDALLRSFRVADWSLFPDAS